MNSCTQHESLLIGSDKAIKSLSQKDSALILVISDSHGDASAIEKVILESEENFDAFIFCGDGFSDILSLIRRSYSDSVLEQKLPPVIAAVTGNCDLPNYPLLNKQSITNPAAEKFITLRIPETQCITIASKKIFIAHGHRFYVDYNTQKLKEEIRKAEAIIGLHGHTHVAYSSTDSDLTMICPGSISRPRAGQKPCYAVLTVDSSKPGVTAAFRRYGNADNDMFQKFFFED